MKLKYVRENLPHIFSTFLQAKRPQKLENKIVLTFSSYFL